MQTHTRTLLQRALWGLSLLLYVGALAGASAHHDDDLRPFGLQAAEAVEFGQETLPGGEPRVPAPDFDCVLCVAANLQVVPQAAMTLGAPSVLRVTSILPGYHLYDDGRPALARHPRGPPPA